MEIAFDFGFASEAQFSRAFRLAYGVSPGGRADNAWTNIAPRRLALEPPIAKLARFVK